MTALTCGLGVPLAMSVRAQALPPYTPEPAPLLGQLTPLPVPSGLAVQITPYVTIPADTPDGSGAASRINYVVPDPGNSHRQFVNDTTGILYSVTNGAVVTPYLNLTQQGVGFANLDVTQTGFQGIAFNPNFDGDPAKPGYGVFYTTFSTPTQGPPSAATYQGQPVTFLADHAGNHVTVLREWTATDPNAATFSGTSRTVLTIGADGVGHNDGTIAFNPTAKPGTADYGNLYVGIGVSGFNDPSLNGGNLANPAGKILRIAPLAAGGAPFGIPADNPFVGQAGALPEIYAYGLRYPQSFSWDTQTGTMYINDIGQAALEEVDVGKAGANYGWPYRQGTVATGYDYGVDNPDDQNAYPIPASDTGAGLTNPIAEYGHGGNYAIGSGFLYRGARLPQLDGDYILQDIVNGNLFYFDPASVPAGGQAQLYSLQVEQDGHLINLVSAYGYDSPYLFGPRVDARLSEDASGELDLALKSTGEIFQLTGAVALSVPVPEPGGPMLFAFALAALGRVRRLHPRLAAVAGLPR